MIKCLKIAASIELKYKDELELENTLVVSRKLASEMESLSGEIQRQLSINAVALTDQVKLFNYRKTISSLLYIMYYFTGVR